MTDISDYIRRREHLAEQVGIPILLAAHTALQAKSDMAYPFVQEPSFLYLSGIDEADWKLFYDGTAWHLIRPEISAAKQIFDGSLPNEVAMRRSGIDSILDEQAFRTRLEALVPRTIATIGEDPMKKHYEFSLNPAQASLETHLKQFGFTIESCRDVLRKMRAIKTPAEQEAMQRAIDLTVEGFQAVRKQIHTYAYEYEIEAHFNAAFRASGGGGHAYNPIVAAGKNACTLHYGANQASLPKNGLVLLDIGAKIDGYAADITRTYAIGTPSEREVAVHAAVEAAHHSIIAQIKPGVTFEAYQESVDKIMKRALVSLGLMKTLEDESNYRIYFPHAIGHGLGIDVHESLGGYSELREGMVLTVEPGIYIPEEGIGVRIEDNILVTKDGNRNLSGHLAVAL